MIPTLIRLTPECYKVLVALADDLGQPAARVVEDCLWNSPRFRAFAEKHKVVRPQRKRPGRPPSGESEPL